MRIHMGLLGPYCVYACCVKRLPLLRVVMLFLISVGMFVHTQFVYALHGCLLLREPACITLYRQVICHRALYLLFA